MTFTPDIYAIDFGTSNSLLAAASAEGTTAPVALDPLAADPTILRSVLYFPPSGGVFVGLEAIRRYVESGMEGRVIRSMKKHLPSRHFTGTQLGGRHVAPEGLVAIVLREMRARADAHFGADVRRVLLGRPARFSDDPSADRLGQDRLERAARLAGFEDVHFLPEPVAAARDFATELSVERVALIADFGGGTSDFTVVRLGPRDFAPADVLAIGGVSVAGDALDGTLMRRRVAKHFGAEVTYRVPFGQNELRMPPAIVERLCSPFDLTILRRQDISTFLRNVRSRSLGPDDRRSIDRLFVLVDDALGFQLFEAIERAKRELSARPATEIALDYPSIEVREPVTRDEFERDSARETDAILRALDDTVSTSGLRHDEIELVCCTGGTARVPRIATEMRARFGEERVRDFKSFHSVVEGLAVHARSLVAA